MDVLGAREARWDKSDWRFYCTSSGPGRSQPLIHGLSKDIGKAGAITVPLYMSENGSPGRVGGSPRVQASESLGFEQAEHALSHF